MPENGFRVVKIMLASPSDTKDLRDAVELSIRRLSDEFEESRGIVLRPVRWELDSVPQQGHPQEVLNQQLLGPSDMIIAIFRQRIGTPTKNHPSGTIEEIKEAIAQGKPVQIYFSREPFDFWSSDSHQLESLREFKTWCGANTLHSQFDNSKDFIHQVETHLRKRITQYANSGELRTVSVGTPVSSEAVEPEAGTSEQSARRASLEEPMATVPDSPAVTASTPASNTSAQAQNGDREGDREISLVTSDDDNSEGAIATLRERVAIADGGTAFNLGVLLNKSGDREGAIAAYRQGIALNHGGAASNLGVLLKEHGRIDDAIAAYRQGIALNHGGAASNLGNLLAEQGRIDDAIAAYRQGIALNHGGAAYNLGVLLKEQGRIDDAIAAYRQGIALNDGGAAFNLGMLQLELGDVESATAAIRKALELGFEHPEGDVRELLAELEGEIDAS